MTTGKHSQVASLGLRAGDWVVVRTKEEILSTLNPDGTLDALPFQPEMFAFCGQKLRVFKVAHKTCDNIKKTGGRRMYRAVHLEGARCNGSDHGGCQADCIFFWKEAWLKRAHDAQKISSGIAPGSALCAESDVYRAVRVPGEEQSADPTWVCQTTKLYDATELLHWWDIRQYCRDVTSGNHGLWHISKLLLFAGYRKLVELGIGYSLLVKIYNRFQNWRGGKPYPIGDGKIPDGQSTPTDILNLQPGEWVMVKSSEEIRATITKSGMNRGMRYDQEMAKYSGGRYRVQMRVDRLINEQTGKMMQMKSPCIQLENVYCRAECTTMRIGCPRASNTYWREIWLRRVTT